MNCIFYNYYNFVCSINMSIRKEFQRVVRKIDITLQKLKAALVLVFSKLHPGSFIQIQKYLIYF